LTNTRVVCHIDMECFYVQVERGINPSLQGRPVAVSQYNPFGDLKTVKPHDCRIDISNGSLIAVSYEARAQGVKRNMRGAEAKTVCPDLVLVQVPTDHGKADLNIYREAGRNSPLHRLSFCTSVTCVCLGIV
jgi:DNA polymerase eta